MDRDYLREAFDIIQGTTLLLPEKRHLLALRSYYIDCYVEEERDGRGYSDTPDKAQLIDFGSRGVVA